MENIISKLLELENLLLEQRILQKEVFSLKEAAQYLDISTSHLYKLTSRKEIPHYCPQGKRLYFKRAELDQWLTRNRVSSNQELETKAANYLLKSKANGE